MKPTCSYLVCATPRSGSTLLCHLLEQTGVAGRPQEYFEALRHSGCPRRPEEYFDPEEHADIVERLAFREMPDRPAQPSPLWEPDSYGRYLDWALEQGTTPNGVFGAKMMWGYLDDFAALLDSVDGCAGRSVPDRLHHAFPGLRYVRITRRDKARQAISLWKAVQTQAWVAARDRAAARPTVVPSYDHHAVDHLVRQLAEHDAAWLGYFTGLGVEPLVITYEDLTEDFAGAVRRVLDHIGVRAPADLVIEQPPLTIQADSTSEEWVRRYRNGG